MKLPMRKLVFEYAGESFPCEVIRLPKRKPVFVIPEGFETLQLNKLFDAPPTNAHKVWRDVASGKWACEILVEKDRHRT